MTSPHDLPDDVQRHSYTADREAGLHVKGLRGTGSEPRRARVELAGGIYATVGYEGGHPDRLALYDAGGSFVAAANLDKRSRSELAAALLGLPEVVEVESGHDEQTEGLREALTLLNTVAQAHTDEDVSHEWRWFNATNVLLMAIAEREGKSIKDVAAEFKGDSHGPG